MSSSRPADISLPAGLAWPDWIRRWDAMQRRHLPGWDERLGVLVDTLAAAGPRAAHVVDLGCGTGTLMARVLERCPEAAVVGIDLDSRLLALARRRLEPFGRRVRLLHADLREPGWADPLDAPADAVVSATTLHWLSAEQLSALYAAVACVLADGGIFLNADHVATEVPALAAAWADQREAWARRQADEGAEDWNAFWLAFNEALGIDGEGFCCRVFGAWEGVEQGLPLPWHFAALADAGLGCCDCYWRRGGDAVYGAVKPAGGPAGAQREANE